MKNKLTLLLLIGLLTGCSSDNTAEREAMLGVLEGCPDGGTVSTTIEMGWWSNSMSLTCTWEKKADDDE